jgi:hypothetical protein
MIDVAILRAAGLTDAQIVRVTELYHADRNARRREQNRIAQQKHRARKHVSADSADIDDKALVFSEGSVVLQSFGIEKKYTGAIIARWVKAHDPRKVLWAIQQARDHDVKAPIPYVTAILNGNSHGHPRKQTLSELAHDIADQVQEREAELGVRRARDIV